MRIIHILIICTVIPTLGLGASPCPAAAQAGVPGGGGGSAGRHMAEYYGYMLHEVSTMIDRFETAWRNPEDPNEMQELYHEEATIVVNGAFPVRGRENIYARLHELVPQRWDLRLTIVDFEASGEMAMVYGQLGESEGKHVTMFKRFGRDWYIVRQFFMGVPPRSPGN